MRYEKNITKKEINMKHDQIKYFSQLQYDKAYAYNFYIAPVARELLKELNREKGLPISKTINMAILEFYKNNR